MMIDDDLKQLIENSAAKTRDHVDNTAAELRRHFDVSVEASKHETQLIAEQYTDLKSEVATLAKTMERGFSETQAMIKFSYTDLDRRFRTLEQTVADLQVRVERLESTH